MPQTEFIFFDLGKVICFFDHEQAVIQMAECAGLSPDVVRRLVFEGELQEQYETGLISTQQFHQAFCEATNSSPDLEELMFAGSDIFWLNYSIMPIIAQLRSASFPMGILSNTCEAHWEFVCQAFPSIKNYFPNRILSYEVHSMKPDAKIYAEAIKLADVSPNRIFFVDDKPENVAGAIAAGIDAVQFKCARQFSKQLMDRNVRINL